MSGPNRHQAGATVAGEKTGGQFKAAARTTPSGTALNGPEPQFVSRNPDRTKRAAASLLEGGEGDFPQLTILAQTGTCTDLDGAVAEARKAASKRQALLSADEQQLRVDLRQARQDRMSHAGAGIRPEAERIRQILTEAGVTYPPNWEEMGSSEKDLWEERQLAALRG